MKNQVLGIVVAVLAFSGSAWAGPGVNIDAKGVALHGHDPVAYFTVGQPTKGDANETIDPFLVPEGALVGVVELTLPMAGFVMAMMAQPSGFLSLATGLIAFYFALSILEEPTTRRARAGASRWVGRETAA